MSKFNRVQTTFSNGEFSPEAQGVVDAEEYKNGADTIENFIAQKVTGAKKRPGTQFKKAITGIGTVPANGGPALLPFKFSKKEAYTIVIRPNGVIPSTTDFLQIYKNDAALTQSTITNLTLGILSASLDPRGFIYAQTADLLFVTHSSGTVLPFVIARGVVDTFFINSISTGLINNAAKINSSLRFPYREVNIDQNLSKE